jgi:hypothetical protein
MCVRFHFNSKLHQQFIKSSSLQTVRRIENKKAAVNRPPLQFALRKLLHQQHLARALDGVCQAALVVRGHSGVFAWQNAALVGDVLTEQIRVLEIQRVLSEVNFRLRARRALFRGAAVAALVFFGVRLAGHII